MKKTVLTMITLCLSVAMMAQQNVNLKLNLEKNKVYRLRSISDQNITQTVNGVDQTTTSQTTNVMSIKMLDAAGDLIIAEVRFDTLLTRTNAMGQIMNMNSTSEGNITSQETSDVMSAIMNRLSKNALFVKMEPTGKVVEIVNMAMLQDIIFKDTAAMTGQLAPVHKTQIKNMVNTDALKSMIESFTFNLPAREVKAGEKWNASTPVNSGGMYLSINTGYKLDNLDNNMVTVTAESTIQTAPNAKPLEYSGAKITYDGIMGIGKSQMRIDAVTGLIVESSTRMNITGDLSVSVQGMNMQIPMKIDSETKTFSIK